MSTLKNDKEQYAKYLSGKMSPEEAHDFERVVLKDPFEQEALEGLEGIDSSDAMEDISTLQTSLIKKESNHSGWMKIAAVVTLLIVSSLTVWMITYPMADNQELAMEKQDTAPEEALTTQNETEESAEVGQSTEIPVSEETPTVTEGKRPAPNPVAVKAETEEIVVETEIADDLQMEKADLEEIDAVDEALQIASITEVEEDVMEEVLSDGGSEIKGIEENALQGKIAGVQISRKASFQQDSINDIDLTNTLVARENARDKNAKRATSRTGSAARSAAFAPSSRIVSGKISDESGQGIPGVNVIEKGSTNGTITDIDGNYQLEVNQEATLIISFVGFETNEIEVGNRETVNVSMGGVTELQEVVVTGIGETNQSISFKAARPDQGNKIYKDYIEENLIYPEAAKANKIEGTVVLEVTVLPTGLISNIDIKKSVGYGCDQEAIRLVREGPQWNPAERDGRRVEDKVRVRVRFKQ
ncbi:MAG: TonB family protein [Cyclobacteriaceae bacterium]